MTRSPEFFSPPRLRSLLLIAIRPRNSTIRCLLLYFPTTPALPFTMVAPVPAQITTLRLRRRATAPRRSLLLPAHPLTPSLFCRPARNGAFVFILLQIPFPATPFFSHPCKTPGVVTSLLPCICTRHRSRVTSHAVSYSCRLFVVAKNANSFGINQIQTLSRKHPGWGIPTQTLPLESAIYKLFLALLRNLCVGSAHSESPRYRLPSILPVLCFHTLTNCFSRNPFVLIFI